jgi:hypothetical protein
MRFLLRLFRWRRRRPRLHAIGEAEAYARAYGDRSEEVVSVAPAVAPVAPPPPAPAPAAPPPAPVAPARARPASGRLTDAALRSAFLARIAARSGRRT